MSVQSDIIFNHVLKREFAELDKYLAGLDSAEKLENINVQNIRGNTALFNATSNQDHRTVEVLLKHGANPDLKNTFGDFALDYAAQAKLDKITELLIKYGASLEQTNRSGVTSAFTAVTFDAFEVLKLLHTAGAKLDSVRNKSGDNILAISCSVGNINTVDWLLDKPEVKKLINEGNLVGVTPLMEASINQTESAEEIALRLMGAGADPKIKAKSGQSALANAVALRKFKAAEIMVDKGADVNVKENFNGYPVVQYAIMSKNDKLFESMVINGADLDSPADDGTTSAELVLSMVDSPKYKDFLEMFLKYYKGDMSKKYAKGTGRDLLQAAIFIKDQSLIKKALKLGCDINYIGKDNLGALDVAFLSGDKQIFDYVISLGPQIDISSGGSLPIHRVANGIALQSMQNLEFLLSIAASASNKPAPKGSTKPANAKPDDRHKEFREKNIDFSKYCIKKYLDMGLSVDVKNEKGNTPFLSSIINGGMVEISSYLMDLGASIYEKNNDGVNAISLYIMMQDGELKEKIESKMNNKANDVFDNFVDFMFLDDEEVLSFRQRSFYVSAVFEILKDNLSLFKEYLDSDNNNMAILAAATGHHDVLSKVLDIDGVDVNHQNVYGETALFHAVSLKDQIMVESILKKSPNLMLKNVDGETVINKIKESKHKTIIDIVDKYITENNIDISDPNEKKAIFNVYRSI